RSPISGGASRLCPRPRSRSRCSDGRSICRSRRHWYWRSPTRSSCFRSASTCLGSGDGWSRPGGGSWLRLADALAGEGHGGERREAEDAPHRRVLEKGGVEEAVHADRGQDDAEDQRDTSGEGPGQEPAEGDQKGGGEQPGEDRQADEAGLGGDRDGRVVGGCGLRLLALEAGPLRVGPLEAADPDSLHRMVRGDREPVLDELVSPSGGAVKRVVTDARHRERRDENDHRDHAEERERLPAPREPGDDTDPDDEGHEARLREGEDEPDEGRHDRRRRRHDDAPRGSLDNEHETGEDRNDEKAAVDGRVPEDRVDAVERRIRVVDADLWVPEDVPGLVLVDADRGEYDGHPGQERPHVAEPCALPRKT